MSFRDERQFPLLLPLTLLLLLLLWFVAPIEATHARFRLRRASEDSERMSIEAYAGHPERSIGLTLTFATPATFHSPDLWQESATQGDLPGLHAAIYMSSDDPLAQELVAGNGPSGTLLALPRMRLVSLGTRHTWAVNTSFRQPAAEVRVPYSNRGLFLLGPSSALWLKTRYARLTQNELLLTDTLPQLHDARRRTDYVRLPCVGRDAYSRCVLALNNATSAALRLRSAKHGTNVEPRTLPGPSRIVLDLDSPTTLLPSSLASRLLGSSAASASMVLEWLVPDAAGAWPLAHADDLSSSALQDSRTRHAAYAVVATGDADVLVIGRPLAMRLFGEMVYDSGEAAWYVRAADTSDTYNEPVVRWVLAVSLVAMALLLGRQLLHPAQVELANLLESLYVGTQRLSPLGARALHWLNAVLICGTAIVQCILGLVYLDRGAGVIADRVPVLRAVGIVLAAAVAVLVVAVGWLMVAVRRDRGMYTPTVMYFVGVFYTIICVCGLALAVLPRAARGTPEIVLLATLLGLLVFFVVHVIMTGLHVIPRRLLYRATRGNQINFRRHTVLWLAALTCAAAFLFALLLAGIETVAIEGVSALAVLSSDTAIANLARALLVTVMLVSVWMTQMLALVVDMWQYRRLNTKVA